jgi:hypothetical protein
MNLEEVMARRAAKEAEVKRSKLALLEMLFWDTDFSPEAVRRDRLKELEAKPGRLLLHSWMDGRAGGHLATRCIV